MVEQVVSHQVYHPASGCGTSCGGSSGCGSSCGGCAPACSSCN